VDDEVCFCTGGGSPKKIFTLSFPVRQGTGERRYPNRAGDALLALAGNFRGTSAIRIV
jgi:hypothetical protein